MLVYRFKKHGRGEYTSILIPSLEPFAGVPSAPSSAPLDVTETLLFRGGIFDVMERLDCDDGKVWLHSKDRA